MKSKKFGYFFSIKYIDSNIETHKHVLNTMKDMGVSMYRSEIIEKYPQSIKKIHVRSNKLAEGTQRVLRSTDFAVAYFTDKSRVVFFQTILALENKTPVLCLVRDDEYANFPETILAYGQDFIKVKRYKDLNQLTEILQEYVEDLEPPKRRFNIVLKTKTLKQLEQLSKHQDTTKADLLRRLIDKEYLKYFGSK